MRRGLLILLLSVAALQGFAAKPVTVAQLEKLLGSAHGIKDEKAASQIVALELTERLSAVRAARLDAALPGAKAREALLALADSAEFRPLPAEERPAMAPLASGAQAALLSLASKSLRREIARFPNFLATRVTTRFEDTPSLPATLDRPAGWYRPLHWVGTSTTNVLNRNGQEVVDPGQAKEAKSGYKPQGLSTSGEFGTILIILMTDVFRSPIAWVGWESGAAGPLAVFHYSVSSPNSHYQVDVPSKLGILETLPAYHGEIAVDAASGTIVRATLEAELKPNTAVTLANLLVEYGPVEIGGETYILPTRCVALSAVRLTVVHRLANGFGDVGFQFGPQKTEVNDIRFTHYHLFRAETRIVVDENVPPAASPAARESPPPSN